MAKRKSSNSSKPTGRPKPMSGSASIGRRYGCGGKMSTKKKWVKYSTR